MGLVVRRKNKEMKGYEHEEVKIVKCIQPKFQIIDDSDYEYVIYMFEFCDEIIWKSFSSAKRYENSKMNTFSASTRFTNILL